MGELLFSLWEDIAMSDTIDQAAASPHPSVTNVPLEARRPLRVGAHGQTDTGRKRTSNEDQFLIAVLSRALRVMQTSMEQPEVQLGEPEGYLFVVADGVGGHAAGEKASEMAVNSIEKFLVDTLKWCSHLRATAEGDPLLQEFQKALSQANDKVIYEADRNPAWHGMATTMTLGYFFQRELFVAHVGDSRCYLLRSGLLYRLTRDHTFVAEMVRRGILKPEEAAHHAYRHVVTNVVGGDDPGVQVEMHKMALEGGDCLMLCSDGLTEMVSDEEILNILGGTPHTSEACDQLVKRANEKGGKDNVTVVVGRFEE
jgi:serine/threonine protein phosphatase PrpC